MTISKVIVYSFQVPLTPEELSTYLKEKEEQKDIEDGYTLSEEELGRLHYETDAVKKLREAQVLSLNIIELIYRNYVSNYVLVSFNITFFMITYKRLELESQNLQEL